MVVSYFEPRKRNISPVCKTPCLPPSLTPYHAHFSSVISFQKLLSLCFRWQVHDQMNTDSVDVSAWRRLIRRLTGSVNTLKHTFSCPLSAPSSAISFMWNVCISPHQPGRRRKQGREKPGIFNRRWPMINMSVVSLRSSWFMDLHRTGFSIVSLGNNAECDCV